MTWYRKLLGFLKKALLDKSSIFNSKCPEHLAWEGSQKGEEGFLCGKQEAHVNNFPDGKLYA
jgi:hypothetical protein